MNDLHPDDWRTIAATFADMFGAYRTHRAPRGVRGDNFMTPERLGCLLIAGEPVEVTTGHGFRGERIYGVTWSRQADGTPDDRDTMCESLDDVRALLMAQDGFR